MAPVHSSHVSNTFEPLNSLTTIRNIVTFTEGRAGEDDPYVNEDRAVFYQTTRGPVAMAIDGITAFTDWRANLNGHSLTAASLAAETATHVATLMQPGISFSQFRVNLSNALEKVRVNFKVPDDEILGFVLTAYIPWEGKHGGFWQIGDCGYGYSYLDENGTEQWVDSMDGQLAENSEDANLRAELIERELERLGLQDAYPNIDDQILTRLAKEFWDKMHAVRVAKSLRERNYDWLRSAEGLASKSKPVHLLTRRPRKVVVVSDGWERVPRTLEDGLRDHDRWREQDKLMIGRNSDGLKAAKGYVAFSTSAHAKPVSKALNRYPDDVTLVSFEYDTA